MQKFLTILLWILSGAILGLLPMNVQKLYGCDALCEAMHTVSPKGDTELYQRLSLAAQRHAAVIDPYTAVAIAVVESSLRQIVSQSGQDVGLFQFSVYETARRGIDEERLLTDVNYAFREFAKLMGEKREMCLGRYPKTWYACWHSTTPHLHWAYAQKVERYANALRKAAKEGDAVLFAEETAADVHIQ